MLNYDSRLAEPDLEDDDPLEVIVYVVRDRTAPDEILHATTDEADARAYARGLAGSYWTHDTGRKVATNPYVERRRAVLWRTGAEGGDE